MLMLGFPGEVFWKALPKWLGCRFRIEKIDSSHAGSPGVKTLQSAAAWVAAEASREGSLLNGKNAASHHAGSMLQALLIDCLKEKNGVSASAMISEIQLRQAEAWIDAHLSQPITVEDVSTAMGVSARSLERTFKQRRGCTPYQAILRKRFERAREALLRPDETTTVTKIALDHGFFELGRFSVRYRQRYGESPSETLKASMNLKRRYRATISERSLNSQQTDRSSKSASIARLG